MKKWSTCYIKIKVSFSWYKKKNRNHATKTPEK